MNLDKKESVKIAYILWRVGKELVIQMKKFNFVLNGIYPHSFRAGECAGSFGNRFLGFVDVSATINGEAQRLTLGFYRSSGTNSGKVKGQWYPILGIKSISGAFEEFSEAQNFILNHTVGQANRGWLIKSIFFQKPFQGEWMGEEGYSHTTLATSLKLVATQLQKWFEAKQYVDYELINAALFNQTLFSQATLEGSTLPQAKLHDYYLKSIFEELAPANSY